MTVLPAIPHDAERIAPHLRMEDYNELKAVTGQEPLPVLLHGINTARQSWSLFEGNDIVALFGVHDFLENGGIPWMVATNRLNWSKKYFIKHSQEWITRLGSHYERLINFVDARNEAHIRWIKWAGFNVAASPVKYGVEHRPFYRFEMEITSTCAPQQQ